MPKTLLDLRSARPLLDLVSHGRGGPKGRLHLSADQIAAIDRTVRRVPEVMVKVLPKDSQHRSQDIYSCLNVLAVAAVQ